MINEPIGDGGHSGIITNIQRFSIHDGPGIRDVIFIKGCPLRCVWCSNPEAQNSFPEIGFSKDRCIGYDKCGRCLDACVRGATTKSGEGKISIDREMCNDCGECAGICPSKAIRVFGNRMKVDEVVKIIEEDGGF